MAKLLLKAFDATHPDGVKDKKGCHKFGDVIAVVGDGHQFGTAEGIPTFFQIHCPDVQAEELHHLLEPLTEQTIPVDWLDLEAKLAAIQSFQPAGYERSVEGVEHTLLALQAVAPQEMTEQIAVHNAIQAFEVASGQLGMGPTTLVRHRYGFDLTKLNKRFKDTLFAFGAVKVPYHQLQKVLFNKV